MVNYFIKLLKPAKFCGFTKKFTNNQNYHLIKDRQRRLLNFFNINYALQITSLKI